MAQLEWMAVQAWCHLTGGDILKDDMFGDDENEKKSLLRLDILHSSITTENKRGDFTWIWAAMGYFWMTFLQLNNIYELHYGQGYCVQVIREPVMIQIQTCNIQHRVNRSGFRLLCQPDPVKTKLLTPPSRAFSQWFRNDEGGIEGKTDYSERHIMM